MVEQITAGQQVKRPKKANNTKTDEKLKEFVQKNQHQNMIDFLKGWSYNIKLLQVLLFVIVLSFL